MMREFSDGQIIQQRGDEPDGFWLIVEGTVVAGQFLSGGDFRAVAVLGPGDSYGELAVFAASRRKVDALSRGKSKVRFIPGSTFLAALGKHQKSSMALLAALSAQLQHTLDELAGMRRGSNPMRLAALLSNLVGRDGVTKVTQQELAELLGVTRATTNAALRTLEEANLIERGYGLIRVIEPQRLANFSLG